MCSYECCVGGEELGEDVARVAEHGGHHGPLGGQPLDDEARDEDGGDDQEEVDDGERGGPHASHLKRTRIPGYNYSDMRQHNIWSITKSKSSVHIEILFWNNTELSFDFVVFSYVNNWS